jgi:hypothetical protein
MTVMLGFLFELRDPHVEITYVSALPVASATVEYHLSMLPTRVAGAARQRLDLVALGDHDPRPLSDRLLERRPVLEQIGRTIRPSHEAWLVPYTSTVAEQDLGRALGIPVYGPDPMHAHLGTKSGVPVLASGTQQRRPRPAHLARQPRVGRGVGSTSLSLPIPNPRLET